jgi:dihydrofolate reductase
MNSMPKFVVASTLEHPTWDNTTVVTGDVAAEVAKLREEHDLLVAGSAQLVQALAGADLIDELRLMVYPLVLGHGKRLFDEAAAGRAFRVTSTEQSDEVVLLTLERR